MPKYTFGPIISRRLGLSLGVNNIPYKTCSYSCIYCQLGRTENFSIERREFYNWKEIVNDVERTVNELNGKVDYITFVPDGEPLLDKNIGIEISEIKKRVSPKVAVITNSSLLYLEGARSDLSESDLASVKVDATREDVWRRINRPHPKLSLSSILDGIKEFSKTYRGKLITETMLVDGVNSETKSIEEVASFINSINPAKAYISIPVRPPAEQFVKSPSPDKLVEAHEIFKRILGEEKVELLNLPEPPPPSAHGSSEDWILSVTSVHPQKLEYALNALSGITNDPEGVIARLEAEGMIKTVEYAGSKFIVRWFENRKK
ncbi:radical SAM protein [Fervidicoccus fontis]|nr:radical SAM protein [Fervidicoccus fontis]MBE9390960.1 radical SAM protein [Fervidicoccus fontis]PMB76034.1 MAG: radical SAM protein [Fervidicoccus fontis]HEW64254.1 radical SAM protein [Fervidicoccus fontis]